MKQSLAQHIWDNEYTNPQFTSFERGSHQDVKDFLSYLRRKEKIDLEGKTLLDVGCGIGKDVEFAIEHHAMVGMGCDVSPVAILEAKKHAPKGNFFVHDIGTPLKVSAHSVDCALLVMVIHTLSQTERNIVLHEISRVLKPDGFFFLKTLALEGDHHAKFLLKQAPGNEPHSFIHPNLNISEYVYPETQLRADLEQYFKIVSLERTTGYQKWGKRSFKRNYWVAYLQKK